MRLRKCVESCVEVTRLRRGHPAAAAAAGAFLSTTCSLGSQAAGSVLSPAVGLCFLLTLDPCTAVSCPAAAVMPPLECQAGTGIQQTVMPDANPLWQAVKAFQAGEAGALPLSTEWSGQENSTCTPACKYGTCIKVCAPMLTGCRDVLIPRQCLWRQFCRPEVFHYASCFCTVPKLRLLHTMSQHAPSSLQT